MGSIWSSGAKASLPTGWPAWQGGLETLDEGGRRTVPLFLPIKKGQKKKGFEACIMVVLILGEEEILLLSGGKRKGLREYHQTWLSAVHDYLHFRNLSMTIFLIWNRPFFPSDVHWLPEIESGRWWWKSSCSTRELTAALGNNPTVCTTPTLFLYRCHGVFATLNYARPALICALVQTSDPWTRRLGLAYFQAYLSSCVYFQCITSHPQWEITVYSLEYLHPATGKEAKCFSSVILLGHLKK